MQASAMPAKTPYLNSGGGTAHSLMHFRMGLSGLAFLVLCVLIAFGATRPIDWAGQSLLARISTPLLDLVGFLFTLLGEPSITGMVAVVLAWRGWHRRRERGLGPLLLFVGVGIEVLLKYGLPHPGPPAEFSRHLHLPSFFRFSTPVLLHVSTPYSFPSGHMLRTTFLVRLATRRRLQWHTLGLLVVLGMAFTRVYCNEHWVSDVVGGALLGWTLARMAAALEEKQEQENSEHGQRTWEKVLPSGKRALP